MSDSDERDELQRIRERKRERLKRRQAAEQAETGSADSPRTPIEIESHSHFEEVTSTHDLVLVDCYADWCGPCQMMEPTIESLAAESEAAVAKVDVDRHQRLAQQLGAQGVPTLVVFAGGEPVERVVGAQDRATLEQLLQRAA
ncbi:thioredoxin [Halovenus sp. WSH3]|uniref:Thioredoxin n=1 Tax=Halovenus carboxidivorans TaxID=2692199 RepID=A0A6B0T7Z7_9EURY|nr:thioredoxin [Halovenus carboxidivorans]MXR53067.1 thioredoxin [Halovenus carboxidivorans]